MSSWDSYRRIRTYFALSSFFPLIISPLAVLLVLLQVPEKIFQTAFYFTTAVWGVLFVTNALRFSLWLCPQCHKPFFYNWLWVRHFTNNCVHCGLPKYQDPTPGRDDKVRET